MKYYSMAFGFALAAVLYGRCDVQAAESEGTDATGGIAEIIVTAQRREERLQDVPISITAITASQLQSGAINNSSDLAVLTPGLAVPATQNYFQPRIRGVGTLAFGPGIENPIATYIDGVYIASAPASLLSFSDIERVEVLKGPQGTLFGRNATGGLIQIVTQDPTPGLNGTYKLSYGNYQSFAADNYISGGSDTLAADLSTHYDYQEEGYGRNFATGGEANRPLRDFGLRSKFLFSPVETTQIRISADYAVSAGSNPTTRQWSGSVPLFGAPTPGTPWDVNNNFPSANNFEGGGISVRVNQDWDAVRLVSISAFRESRYAFQLDYDTTPTPALTIANIAKDRQVSQELQLASSPTSAVTWVVGAYFLNSTGAYEPSEIGFMGPTVNPMAPVTSVQFVGSQGTKAEAGFGQITVPIADQTHVTAGLRYSSETRRLDATQIVTIADVFNIPTVYDNEARFNKLTWRLALDHKFTPDMLVYLSENRGFKSGGFNVISPADPAYQPEVLDAIELGLKAEFYDHTLRLNPAVFHYEYKNIQLPVFESSGQVGIQSGPAARIDGFDLDFEYLPIDHLRIYGGASALKDRFGLYPNALIGTPIPTGGNAQFVGDASHHQLPFTSKFSGNLGAEYTWPLSRGRLVAGANEYRNSGFYAESDNLRRQSSYGQLSASVAWNAPHDRFWVQAWGKNLTDAAVATQFSTSPQGVGISYQPPRTYGVSMGGKW